VYYSGTFGSIQINHRLGCTISFAIVSLSKPSRTRINFSSTIPAGICILKELLAKWPMHFQPLKRTPYPDSLPIFMLNGEITIDTTNGTLCQSLSLAGSRHLPNISISSIHDNVAEFESLAAHKKKLGTWYHRKQLHS
jgi:hypothetical protein